MLNVHITFSLIYTETYHVMNILNIYMYRDAPENSLRMRGREWRGKDEKNLQKGEGPCPTFI